MRRPLFCDIDGTLTATPDDPDGPVLEERVAALRSLIAEGDEVVVWSARGTAYAVAFCRRHGLAATAIGKPSIVVDDKPTIREPGRMMVVAPEDFFGANP